METSKFEALVNAGNPVGEVIGIDSFMVKIKGLHPTNVHAVVRFDDDTRGYVHEVFDCLLYTSPSPRDS